MKLRACEDAAQRRMPSIVSQPRWAVFFRRPPSCDDVDARFNDVAAIQAWAGQSHPKRELDKKILADQRDDQVAN
jgi:hypothetical protein